MWPFKFRSTAEVRRDVPVIEDMWDVITGKRVGDKPVMADLEKSYQESGVVFAVIREITRVAARAEITAGDVGTRTLLEHPNPEQGFNDFVVKFLTAYLTTGVGYILKHPIGGRAVQELRVLMSSGVTVEEGHPLEPYRHISYSDGRHTIPDLKQEDLIILLSPDTRSAVNPASPLEACWADIRVDMQRETFQREVLKRLPFLVGVAECEGATTKTQRDRLSRSLQRIVGSPLLVLPTGVSLTMPDIAKNFAFTELAQLAETRVCAALNTHPIVCGFSSGLERSTFANYAEARESFYQETITPLLDIMGNAFTRGLGTEITFTLPVPPPREEQTETENEDA